MEAFPWLFIMNIHSLLPFNSHEANLGSAYCDGNLKHVSDSLDAQDIANSN